MSKKGKKKSYKVDIHKLFGHINDNDTEHFNKLTEEEIKAVSPYVIQRWMFGAHSNNEIHTILTDEYVNPYVFSLQHHKLLLCKLLCVANGEIDNTRYSFVKPGRRKKDNSAQLVARHYQCSIKEAYDIMELIGEDGLKELEEIYAS